MNLSEVKMIDPVMAVILKLAKEMAEDMAEEIVEKERVYTAKRMLGKGMKIDDIAEATKLNVTTIEGLQPNM